MANTTHDKLEAALVQLYEEKRGSLDSYPWELEEARWDEFVLSMLIGLGIDAGLARRAVQILSSLELSSVDALADKEQEQLVRGILEQIGVPEATSTRTVNLLQAAAVTTRKRWGGHIQCFLREQGLRMAKDLAAVLQQAGLQEAPAMRAATLWLQNVANLPILLSGDPHIRRFCAQNGVSEEELLESADRLGLNVAVLDDLLTVAAQASAGGSPE